MGLFDMFKKRRKGQSNESVAETKAAPAPKSAAEPKPAAPSAPPARQQASISHPHITTVNGVDHSCADSYGVKVEQPEHLEQLSLYQNVSFREEDGTVYVYRNDIRLGHIEGVHKENILSCDYPYAQIEIIDIAKNELGISVAYYRSLADCPYRDFTLAGTDQIEHFSGAVMHDIIADDVSEGDWVEFIYDAEKHHVAVQATGVCAIIGNANDHDSKVLINLASQYVPEYVSSLLGKVLSITQSDEFDNSTVSVVIRAYKYDGDL